MIDEFGVVLIVVGIFLFNCTGWLWLFKDFKEFLEDNELYQGLEEKTNE